MNHLPQLALLGLLLAGCNKTETPPAPTDAFTQGTLLADRVVTENGLTTTDIYAISPDGTARKLTSTPVGKYSSRGIKAAGADRIVFYSNRDGTEDIYVMNTDGSNLKRLTNDATRDFNPALSPGGSLVAWVSFRNDARGDIWLMNADGTGANALAPDPSSDRSPFFSSDGQRLVFHSYRSQEKAQVFTMAPDGSNLRQLTNGDNPFFAYNPQWSPSGQQILFISERNGTADIYRMNANGSNQTLLRPNNGHSYMVYAPNGRQMAFNGDRPEKGNFRQIYTALLTGSVGPQKVSPRSASETDYYGLTGWY